jgi:hypothetical protein
MPVTERDDAPELCQRGERFERAGRLHLCPEQAAYAKPTEH